ncbi:MFS transporter family glucose-6-phosphate receptor UhpC [Glaesserella parasuis]|uniref:MFS transporter family glucose-6-phosphate receptor UhpC n=2 Tax=Glaesserella parasuis TaxID=738 RepID=A0AAJ6AGR8_GLAPU|nr:MFS transporter family glucose-6-phosphate receptor UhpC [Glaesserella parasuis]MDG6309068.1 MFS transporter family glucose-6-phosphate receptor UhpC [Glaesserella parasuis]MDG6360921.1 MFS transporter family glucose-6-phosphate receptor UhpC [Glaesserella parasuis]MDG6447526.1 MFS transporter family glucose-6-phosphate receptor UhpC [Glaesserella parasuis]MDG6473270.1 MFS transporter family glucose-6-phosphate receptor UhpC [Glaesserella parasuis]MDG6475903.1 MFS transporter family glucose
MKIMENQSHKIYHYWRLHIMIGMYIGYAGFYLTRKSFNYVVPTLITDLGIDKNNIGIISTLFYIAYGISKFISGVYLDKENPKHFMAYGLFLTGITNILFGLSSSVLMFTILWVINAWFQGWGWPSCSKLLTTWYSRNERGLWWSIWNTAHNVGGAMIPLIIGYLTLHYSWRYGFIAAGGLAILISIFLFFRLQNTPETMGLPSIGKWRNDNLELAQEKEGKYLTWNKILHQYVFFNKYIWLLALSYALVYVVRTAINDWGNIYLTEKYHYDLVSANSALSLFEVGGFIGSLVAGWGSDKLFASNRGPMALLFAIGIFFSIIAMWLMPKENFILQAGIFFSVGFFVFGPQMLIGMAAAECSHKKTPASATGFVGLFAYLGAAIAGYPLALVMESYHWSGFFVVIACAASGIALLLLPFLKAQN